jgi:hypothetical protein
MSVNALAADIGRLEGRVATPSQQMFVGTGDFALARPAAKRDDLAPR